MTDTEAVETYSSLIEAERRRVKESMERIAEWAAKLEEAASRLARQ